MEQDQVGSSSTLRILVATDCHLGYLEKDGIRRFDSFDTFEEICSLAVLNKVDFMLLGGNLFHENSPSHLTLVKCMEILRRYCLNDRPVQFQVVSDQAACLQNRTGRANYEDPNLHIGLPVFTIHGDHDDPAGLDKLSAIDILSACNFVNYFGKVDLGSSNVGQTSINPILIKKGATSVALYGLGNIRDQRLSRMFQKPHAIEWMLPENQYDMPQSAWFNIFILHQNRIKGINEKLLPRFLDLVIWGHEHECIIEPEEVPGKGFHITQPGSSVVTSLSKGEAKQKHVFLLEIKGRQYRSTNLPLKSVRPFEYSEISFKDQVGVDNNVTSIHEQLDELVSNLIEKSSKTAVSGSEPKLPLVRVKVECSELSTINIQRFGQKYVGKVANPNDILVFSRSDRRFQTQGHTDVSEQTVETLIKQTNLKTQILCVNDLDTALHDFINKDDNMAFHSCLQRSIEVAKNKLISSMEDFKITEDEMVLDLDKCMQVQAKERTETTSSSQSLPTNALSAFEELKYSSNEEQDTQESDELIETSDGECSQLAGLKRPSPRDGGSESSRRRKTDLASFQRPTSKNNEGHGTKKSQAHVAGRYGAIRRR